MSVEKDTTHSGLGRSAARGGMIVLGGQGVRILVQVASVVVLSRLLTPRDYGLVAMVLAVVAVAEIFRDLGLSTAAVQAKVLTRAQQSNLWWLNTALGLGLALVAIAAAPLVAALYDEPALTALTAAMAGMFVLNGMAAQYRADLTRRLLFTRLAAAEVAAPLVALGIAAYAAANGAGYWALVVQQLVQGAVALALAGAFAGWLPGRPRRGVEMSGFLRFGWSLAGTQLINYAANNIDSVLIGTRLGAHSLGTYNRAWQLLMTPLGQLRNPTTTVALPVLSRIRDNPALTQRFVERGQVALGYSLGAGLGLVAGAAAPVCALFLGPGWDVAGVFALLACAGLFQTLAYVGYWVYLAHGLITELRHYTLVASALKVVCVLVGVRYGITGVAAGFAAAHLLEWPLSLWWISRRTQLRVGPLYLGAARILLVAAAVAVSAYATAQVLHGQHPAVTVPACAAAGAAAYALLLVVPPVRRDVRSLVVTVRGALRQKINRG
ncbi:PST family polysaccharide transporter [Nocardioides albertanoniae]|uniref:PST family polysaccharide transporter n=1 Tax=Nocardioides albertanoniae TaxID=1175486 RepID=A0A543ABM2_9ACTN|nr:lipopolysaccharide biosynthesis protein [Nocardioides albertanoniae]TQL69957.1 PST family polysaccharide transporter [Nocardioides albertanoniae]